jgi:hypothetical protein
MVGMDDSWCPSCGYSALPGAQFCGSCGQQLAAPVGAAPVQPSTVTMQSPSMGGQPLSAPPMMPMPPQPTTAQPPQGPPNGPPPPTPDSRLPWPPPPAGGPPNQTAPALSDTMDRMLRPQGLFQSPWQQPWATPPVNGGVPAGGPTPPPPAGGSYQGGGQYPGGNPQQPYQTEPMAQPGQYGPGQYAPGQYGQGQLAQGQPPAGQYGPGGQFAADQFNQGGQYPPGQYGQGQYPADQYATGQYGPGGQYGPPGLYGPGTLFGPDGSPVPDQKRPLTFGKITLPRSPLVPAIAVAALVVIAVTAVVLSASGSPGSSPGTAAGGAAGTATSSSRASSDAEQLQAATALSGLLAQSGKDRTNVIDAYTNVQDCGHNLAHDAQIFRNDAANRRALLAKVQVLPDRSALSSAMLSDLTGGWQASATVDDDLAKWADAAAGHCKGGDMNNPSLKASLAYDGPATEGKVAFTHLWNPLARKDGLPTYQNTQI